MAPKRIKVRAAGFIFHEDRLLLLEHIKGKKRYWVVPGGGIEPGETVRKALVREMKEELGLDVVESSYLFSDEVILPGKHNIDIYFLCSVKGLDRITVEDSPGIGRFAFFSEKEIQGLTMRPDLRDPILRIFRKEELQGFCHDTN